MKNHLLNSKRSVFFLCILLVNIQIAKATTYYFSSSTGNDSRTATQAQNAATPWKTIAKLNSYFSNLKPGDSALFKRGDSFIGLLAISKSGTSAFPITISAYGIGNAPVFQYDIASNLSKPISQRVIIYAAAGITYITIDGIKFTDTTMSTSTIHTATTANVGYAIDFDGSNTTGCNNIVLKNLDISLVGNAIELHGDNNTITNCAINDLGGIRNNINDEGNFGANGITFGGSNNIITYNTLKNLWRTDKTFGYDGGAFEVFGAVSGQCSNNTVMYNTVINCQGVMELGSNISSDLFNNNIYAYNIFINNGGRVFTLHNGGDAFSLKVNNLQVYNNNVIENTIPVFGLRSTAFWSSATTSTNTLISKNNVFWIDVNLTIVKSTFNNSGFIHTNNIYRMTSGSLGFTLNSNELNTSSISLFKNTSSTDPSNWDYHLPSTSPAIDFGTNVGLTVDYNGNKVFSGKAPDASAIENMNTSINIYYRDADNDGYGNSADTLMRASQPAGYVSKDGDCNDKDATIYPGAPEIYDGKDNNCDGRIDEGWTIYYKDADKDGYGNLTDTVIRTSQPLGYATKGGDCNDTDATIYMGAPEICDGKDNNCDGRIDENCSVTPSLNINDVTIYQTPGTATLTVSLSEVSRQMVSVNYATFDGSATSPKDYKAVTGTITIPAGSLTATLDVSIMKDKTKGAGGYFYVKLTAPQNATLGSSAGQVNILTGLNLQSKSMYSANVFADANKAVDSEQKNLVVKVSPNPSAYYFNVLINSKNNEAIIIRIVDLEGRLIETKKITSSVAMQQVGEHLTSGVYILEVLQGKERVQMKLIKL